MYATPSGRSSQLSTYRIAGKFGRELNLAVYITTVKLKSTKISYSHIIIRMAIPYQTTKFKSAIILAIVILGLTAKFNSCQYFQVYGIMLLGIYMYMYCVHVSITKFYEVLPIMLLNFICL